MGRLVGRPEHADFWETAWRGEPADWDRVLGDYEASVDWPACTFYEELLERYPEAKVLLSVRDPERWYESARTTIYELTMLRDRSPFARLGLALATSIRFGTFTTRPLEMGEEIIWRGTFEGKFEHKHHAIEVFNRHNEEVKRRVPPERLLVYEVREGWGPLCEFLGVEEPANPFPRFHEAAETRRVIQAVRVFSVVMPTTLALLVSIAALMLLRRGSLGS